MDPYSSIDQPPKTYISSVWTLYAAEKTYQKRWIVGKDGERESYI